MKSIFSILLLSVFSTQASQITIAYQSDKHIDISKHIKKRFEQTYSIPQELISVVKVDYCKSLDERFLEFCIKKDSDLILLNSDKSQQKIRSLKIFNLN